MHVGSIVHEIMQKVLRQNATTLKEIKKISDDFLSNDIIHLLYSCRMTSIEMEMEIEPFLNRIHEFMRQYIVGDVNNADDSQNHKQFAGRISEIRDIEENVWCPRLGLKGKIDVTVKVHPPNKFFDSFQKLMPLEIKTGKSSFSLEHKGQLLLYQMMLQDLGQQIDSGLLLYIRDGVMAELSPKRIENCGLIQMRNRLAHFFKMDIVNSKKEANLPDPINHHSACSRCEYNTVCCTFLDEKKLKTDHPLVKVKATVAGHLSQAHIDYFLHWCHLITLEHNESQMNIKLRHIWTKTPEARATKGTALANLKLRDLVHPQGDDFIHHFGSSNASFDFTSSTFDIGEYLIVSTDKRCSVAAGRVTKIEPTSITLSLPKDLSVQYSSFKFHIDRYESASQSVFNYSNIAALLEKETLLRRIIVDKELAIFSKTLPQIVAQQGGKILLQLNPMQRKAVLKALTCENYMLIKGLPGTGKTQTLTILIQLLGIMKKSILITSHTNSAVDNILLRLKEKRMKFMRLGSATKVHPSLRDFQESSLIVNCKSVDDLEKIYAQQNIVAVTCLGSAHALLSQRKFDYCLVDEATQIFQPTVIRPLLSAARFILVGDPQQLAPIVRSSDARLLGADESLFERLDSPECTMVLGLQYRMNRVIAKLANSLTYEGQLKCANVFVENAVMIVPRLQILKEELKTEKWLAKALSTHIDLSYSLINTSNVYQLASEFAKNVIDNSKKELSDKLYVNYCEIAIVLKIVDMLIDHGVTGELIGVIAPYRSQVDAIKKILSHQATVEVNTVDQYQGRDKSIIVYSCTQSSLITDVPKSSEVEILDDRRRLTVAITRAKHKLIVIGDVNCLNSYSPFRDLFKHMTTLSKFQVEDDKMGFSWNKLLQNLRPKL